MNYLGKLNTHKWILLLLLVAGCAAGKVGANGEIIGIAFGSSELVVCPKVVTIIIHETSTPTTTTTPTPTGTPPVVIADSVKLNLGPTSTIGPTFTPTITPIYECSRIKGGSLSTGAVQFLDTLITAIIAYFSAGAVT